MKKTTIILTLIVLKAWALPAMAQSALEGTLCQFYNIDKTVRAKLGTGEDAQYQKNTIKAFWPVMLNGKECPKLQEALCFWLTDEKNIKLLDKAIDSTLFTDNEGEPFGNNGVPYLILDNFDEVESFISTSSSSIELKSLSKRFATFHLFSYMYPAGAAHGIFCHNYMTYDTEIDKIVTLEDILVDPELIRPHIMKSINLKYDYTEEDLFLPEDNIMPIPKVFYFDEGFLHLVYQVYEIASFAQGDIDVPIFYPNDENTPEYLTPYGQEVMKESFNEDLY